MYSSMCGVCAVYVCVHRIDWELNSNIRTVRGVCTSYCCICAVFMAGYGIQCSAAAVCGGHINTHI